MLKHKKKKMTHNNKETQPLGLNSFQEDEKRDLENEILKRGVADIITEQGLKDRLLEKKPLRVKYGIDPTMRSAHIGHAVPIRKLKQFQELGHVAVFIIGDYTARIGDPSGMSATRKVLSAEEVQRNAEKYFQQVYKILDRDKTEIRLQSEWYGQFDLEKLIRLMSKVTYGQLMSHETFSKRVKDGKVLAFHEMLYPVLQAYDSVAVKADVELGGIDQRFNFVLTRDLQKSFGQRPEEVILTKYLPGIDGQEKMSKSLGNTVDLLDSSANMFFKIMSIPDELMPIFFELATDLPLEQVKSLISRWKTGDIHPMDLKKILARNITVLYHSADEVHQAEKKFERQIQRKEIPDNIPVVNMSESSVNVIGLLVSTGMATSRSEAKRLVGQKAVEIDGNPITNYQLPITIKDGMIIKVGKRKFLKISANQQ
ncbi:MAG: tyrosine--tRNA ligase [Patescibacteria group bacterium]